MFTEEIDPVITLIVRAYDGGIPSLASEVPVQIFTTEVSAPRAMKFIFPGMITIVVKRMLQLCDSSVVVNG